MRHQNSFFGTRLVMAVMLLLAGLTFRPGLAAAEPNMGEILRAVVQVHAEVPEKARTYNSLGPSRTGSGIVIGKDGLIVTIGYLVMEAKQLRVRTRDGTTSLADFVAYDHETGFGLLRARDPLGVVPLELGNSTEALEGTGLLVVSVGQGIPITPVRVVSRRTFAGYWEYLLDSAIYTMPPHREYGGAALVDLTGKLVGVGSLFISDAPGPGSEGYGNMFVPIEELKPVLETLVASGRPSRAAEPWLGVYTLEAEGQLVIRRLAVEGPGEQAGLRPGEVILGVSGQKVTGMVDFFRKIRASGKAGAEVVLDVLSHKEADIDVRQVAVKSRDRLGWLRLSAGSAN